MEARNFGAMWLKNISSNRVYRLYSAVIVICFCYSLLIHTPVLSADSTEPSIQIVYPKEGQFISSVDSTFILGHIISDNHNHEWLLYINGFPVPVHRDGGFIAFLPIEPGEFVFRLEAYLNDHETDAHRAYHKQERYDRSFVPIIAETLLVRVPEPIQTIPPDTLKISEQYQTPKQNLVLFNGDRLRVSFQGTPGCRAWFEIPGVIDSVPMTETTPQTQAYWGESVFGAGAVPDSLLVRGIYHSFYDIPDDKSVDSVRVVYHLATPDKEKLRHLILVGELDESDSVITCLLQLPDSAVERKGSSTITINPVSYPFTVQFTDSVQIVRYGPRKGYLSVFQPEGIRALAVGKTGDWYKIQLSRTQYGWVNQESVEPLPKGILPPISYIVSLRTYSYPDRLQIEIPLKGKHPFRVIEDDRRTIRLQLFGVTSDTDWIRYDFSDKLVDLITWSQLEEGLYELKIMLNQDIWGYDTYYEGNTLYFQLNRPPERVGKIKGKTVVIDPGHSKDPGAIGPTGYTEADANLSIALALRNVLQSQGAHVIMTRSDASDVPLYDRPAIAKLNDADLFISIHNNALPDGVNPFINNGTSAYYYNLHSIDLARTIHEEMLQETGLKDHGLFHGNLAVLRPTQYPAVLVECAFMLLPEQEANLKTGYFQKKVAKAIARGIENFLKQYRRQQR